MTIDMELKDRNLSKIKPKRERVGRRNNTPNIIDKNSPEYKKKRKKKIRIIALIIFFLAFGILGFLAYKGYIFSQELGFVFSPQSIITSKKNELQKDSSGRYTNILITGLDTRESGGLLNTDTIILVSYDYKSNNILLVSVPRDFHVEVAEDVRWYARINSIYSSAEQKKKESGIEELVKTVERLTGHEIQYHAVVDFNAFVEIIDAVGGIDVNVENTFTDYMYPKGLGYQTVSFNAGPQTMDGETALKYSRSRHSPHNSEGTDFARARRQQRVLIALKDKLLSSESFTNPKTLMNILSSISGNLRVSDFTISDIEATFKLARKYDENNGKTYSFVLDPTVGAGLLVERKSLESGAYAIGPKLGLGEYDDIKDFLKLVKRTPEIYSENPRIMVYDTGIGFQNAREETEELKEELPYLNIVFAGTLFNDKDETLVYSNQDTEETTSFPYTVKSVSKILKTDLVEKPEYITSNLNGQDVTILLGKDTQLTKE
jgi:polyisoprenyl-teichoic acid--peptidoglycan teichoic acid transferase